MNVEELGNESVPENMTAVLKALSDPNRLRIFAALLRGVSCNGWLTEELGLPANLLSHHLKVLREAGLVQDRRDAVDGRWIYYQVDVSTLASIHQWLGDFLNPARVALQPHLCGPEATASESNNLAANFVLEAATA
ncbi:MAG: metalloregulator ArsR/SmtB family transcription factor [Candidatus Promineifilaceae bacterium]